MPRMLQADLTRRPHRSHHNRHRTTVKSYGARRIDEVSAMKPFVALCTMLRQSCVPSCSEDHARFVLLA
jgi:hypothetical protein